MMRLNATLLLIGLLHVLLGSAMAFTVPRQQQASNKNTCLTAKKKKNTPRKPRFAQVAHDYNANKPQERQSEEPLANKVKASTSLQQQPRKSVVSGSTSRSFAPKKATTTRTMKPSFQPPSPSVPDQSQVNLDNMWKSHKSIDELEDIMTRRWGKDLSDWVADPNEYEQEEQTSSMHSKTSSKPVLDPWQKQEYQDRKNTQKQQQEQQQGVFGGGDDNNNNNVLGRAKRNQKMYQQQRQQQQDTSTNAVAWANLVDDDDSNDYYDEDDEGFEANDDDDDDIVGKLISRKPVGGKGTNAAEDPPSPGYFFNPGAVEQQESSSSLDTVAAPKENDRRVVVETSKSTRLKPRYDENGNPLFLTLNQAEANCQTTTTLPQDDDDGTSDSSQNDNDDEVGSWRDLGIINKKLVKNLQSMGCEAPLSVQKKSCPKILTGMDVLVGTATGSGKTLCFLVPLAQQLLLMEADNNNNDIQLIVVAPGRELASQIASVARSLLEGTKRSVMLAIGGTTFTRNLEHIRKKKPTVVVGTPGRIAELVVGQAGDKGGRLKVPFLQAIVLDEFDALLEYKPHRAPTAAIMDALKRRHGNSLQSILCSATANDMMGSEKLNGLLRPGYAVAMADEHDQYLTSPGAAATRVSRTVIHGVVHVARKQLALDTVRRILHTEPFPQQVLIFAADARRVDLVVEKLATMDIIAAPLHGGFKSDKMDRAEVSKAFREGSVGVVVATELAARGLDAPFLTHVINLDLPTDASHYAHRAGRCGRGGRPGVVVSLTTSAKERNVPKRLTDKLGVELYPVELRAGKMQIVDEESSLDTN